MSKTRYIPEGYTNKIERTDLNAVVYTYNKINQNTTILAFSGRRTNPDLHCYVTEGNEEKTIARFFEKVEAIIAHRAGRKTQRLKDRDEFLASLEVGSVLVSSWGYDQTNVDFYQVTSIKGKKVGIRSIASRTAEETGPMSENVSAAPDSFIGLEKFYMVSSCRVTISSCRSASLWNGKPTHCSWYA